MSDEISYTPEEVAGLLKISRFTVYELIKRGELKAYRVGRKVRVEAEDLDAYKRSAKTGTTVKNQPQAGPEPAPSSGLIICGQDIVLDVLTRHLEKQVPGIWVLRNHMGSIDGLLALYRGVANAVTAHLWDGDSGEYNLPYIRRLLPGHRTVVINLVFRQEGFYVAAGNPHNIATWADLKKGVRLINREPGSGARVLLDEQLRLHKIEHNQVLGYGQEESSHLAVASRVARGDADVGLGIEKAALQVPGVEFIPLQKERYDLIIRKQDLALPAFQVLLRVLRSQAFKADVEGLGGYDISRMGDIIAEV